MKYEMLERRIEIVKKVVEEENDLSLGITDGELAQLFDDGKKIITSSDLKIGDSKNIIFYESFKAMTVEEEADFLMKCNEMENMPYIPEALAEFDKMGIPMYVLSNSGFTAEALSFALEKLGIRKYFKEIWSSANYGKIKPSREFFEMAIEQVLLDNPAEKRENIVFVGDTYNSDVRGANDAGIDVIWINHKGERNTENLSVHSISNTSELIGIVK